MANLGGINSNSVYLTVTLYHNHRSTSRIGLRKGRAFRVVSEHDLCNANVLTAKSLILADSVCTVAPYKSDT